MSKATEGFPTFDQPVDFSDVVLVVEGRSFHVHKAILAKWLPVFKAMLTSDFKERSTNQITLPNKKACDVLELLQVLYPPEKPIDSKNVETILCLAREYQMQCVTDRCEKFLLTTDLDLQALAFADAFQLQQLLTACAKQLAKKSLVRLRGIGTMDKFHKLEASTKLAVVEERLRQVSLAGDGVSSALHNLLSELPVCQEWLCDIHTKIWKVIISHDRGSISDRGSVPRQKESIQVYECSRCVIPRILKKLYEIAKRFKDYTQAPLSF